MCNFFSFVTEPEKQGGKRFYFNYEDRLSLIKGKPSYLKLTNGRGADSHSIICSKFGLKEDICNKYEYDPVSQRFSVDQINSEVNDKVQAEEWVRSLDFTKIIGDFKMPSLNQDWKTWQVGDTLTFKPLKEIKELEKHGLIHGGWNDDGYMDKYAKKGMTFTLTKEAMENIEGYMFEIPDARNHAIWYISASMLQKV